MTETSWTLQHVKWIINVLIHQLLAVVLIYSLAISFNGYSAPFSWHVITSTVGLILLMGEALLLFASDNVWSHNISRGNKYIAHGVLMGLGAVLMIFGTAIEIKRTNDIFYYTHFSTAHGATGLISIILLVLALVFGIFAEFAQGLKNILRPVITKFVHNIIGILSFAFGMVSLCCGYYTDWFQFYTREWARVAVTIATIILCVVSLIPSFISAIRQEGFAVLVAVFTATVGSIGAALNLLFNDFLKQYMETPSKSSSDD